MFNKNKDKNFNELLKGSSVSLIVKVLGMVFGYGAMLFVTNFYGADEWGLYALCITFLSISVLLPKFGFDNSLVRIITELKIFNNKDEIVSVLYKSFTIAVFVSFLIIISINLFSDFIVNDILNKRELTPYIKLISFAILPMVILTIVSATFQALKKPLLYVLFQTTLINIVFFIFLVISHFQRIKIMVFELYFFAICTSFFIALTFLIITLKNKKKTKPLKKITFNYKKIINISTPMLLSNSFALFMGWSDIIMLSFFQSTTEIGIYDSALKLSALSGISLMAVNAIATPKFVEFYSKNNLEGLKDTVQKSTKLIFFTATPLLFILVFFSKQILSFMGEEFIVGSLALIYLCISRFINAVSGSVGYIMQMTDQQKVYQNIILQAFVINVILNLILIPKFSYNGAAIASSIAMIYWNVVLVIIIKRKLGFWTFLTFNLKKK